MNEIHEKNLLFYKNVTVIDFSYLDHNKGVVGESLIVDVAIEGAVNDQGMIIDFALVKKQIKQQIDDICDHKIIVDKSAINEKDSIGTPESITVEKQMANYCFYYRAPKCAVLVLDTDQSFNVDNLKKYIEKALKKVLSKNIINCEIVLRKQEMYPDSSYHYTHGLKKHDGNCQRLFHGHSNPVEIFVDNKRRNDLEKIFVNDIIRPNIHFVMKSDIKNYDDLQESLNKESKTSIMLQGNIKSNLMATIAYKSLQGEFVSKLPLSALYIMETETTVELLSKHFFEVFIKRFKLQRDQLKVIFYEGVDKGSIITSVLFLCLCLLNFILLTIGSSIDASAVIKEKINTDDKSGIFSGRVVKVNSDAKLVRVNVDFVNMKYLNKKDKIELWHEVNPYARCQGYLVGKTSEYYLIKIPEFNDCKKNVSLAPGAYVSFYSEDLANNLKVGKELISLLLKKRLAINGLMGEYKAKLDSHIEKVNAVNNRYEVIQEKMRKEWREQLQLLEEDKLEAEEKFSRFKIELNEIDHKLEAYRIGEDNLKEDKWALDSKMYYKK